jgi:hypothetical protein
MPTKLTRPDGKPIVAGDDFEVHVTVSSIPDARTFSKSWLTVKRNETDADVDAILVVTITSGFTVNSGTLTYTIPVTHGQSVLFTPKVKHFFDVQLLDSTGAITTPVSDGEVTFAQQKTIATS